MNLAAPNLPNVQFGPADVRHITWGELDKLPQKARFVARGSSDFLDTRQRHPLKWLRVTTNTPAHVLKYIRSSCISHMFDASWSNLDVVNPHESESPTDLLAPMAALLVLPWEDMTNEMEFDGRPFRYAWHQEIADDVVALPGRLPD